MTLRQKVYGQKCGPREAAPLACRGYLNCAEAIRSADGGGPTALHYPSAITARKHLQPPFLCGGRDDAKQLQSCLVLADAIFLLCSFRRRAILFCFESLCLRFDEFGI